jgi:methionine-rich copper-binding protein CopC
MVKNNAQHVRHLIWNLVIWNLVVLLVSCVQTANVPSGANLVNAAPRANTTEIALPARADMDSHQAYARLFEGAAVARTRFQRYDVIEVHWPEQLAQSGNIVIRIQTAQGRIYLERPFLVAAGAVADLGEAYLIPAGDYEIVLMPTLGDYYLKDISVLRKIAVTLTP